MVVTLAGKVMLVRLGQAWKAWLPMRVTPFSMLTLARLEEYANA